MENKNITIDNLIGIDFYKANETSYIKEFVNTQGGIRVMFAENLDYRIKFIGVETIIAGLKTIDDIVELIKLVDGS